MENRVRNFGRHLLIRWFNLKDFLYTAFHYWTNIRFARVDLTLLLSYFLKSPYRIAREFEETRSEEAAPYGETPLRTLHWIVESAGITSQDRVYELGCGRGRSCFWMAVWLGCPTVGIEYVPQFVYKAERIAQYFQVSNVEFRAEDMLKADLTPATVVYLYGTCLSDTQIRLLIAKFKKLSAGTKIITISYPLEDYTRERLFIIEKVIDVQYAWGHTQAYIQSRASLRL